MERLPRVGDRDLGFPRMDSAIVENFDAQRLAVEPGEDVRPAVGAAWPFRAAARAASTVAYRRNSEIDLTRITPTMAAHPPPRGLKERHLRFRWAHSEQDGASTSPHVQPGDALLADFRPSAADTSHDVVDDDVADIAVDGMAGEATAAKEAVKSAFDWPVGVLLAAISRVPDLPHEGMNVGV